MGTTGSGCVRVYYMEVVSLAPIPSHAKVKRRFMLLCAGGSEPETKH